MQDEFPNTVIPLENYKGIDQGEEGACSFVSFLNMLNITNNQHILKANVFKNWEKTWHSFDVDAAADIGTVIDFMIINKSFKMDPHSILTYVPIRSEGKRERCFNEDSWIKNISDILDKCPWMYQAAYLIETLLDSGVPVEINAMEHSRTCIGYNDDSLIFADNWGMNHHETSDNPYNDSYSAGFSTIDKWAIYTWVRDLVYVDSSDKTKPKPKPKVQTKAKVQPKPKAKAKPKPRITGPKSHKNNHGLEIIEDKDDDCYQYERHHATCKKQGCVYDKTNPIGKKCHSK